jgi:hypothetical protein
MCNALRLRVCAVGSHSQVHSLGLCPGTTIAEPEVDEGLRSQNCTQDLEF